MPVAYFAGKSAKRDDRYPAVIDGELGRSQIGDYRDTLLIAPLTNVTVHPIVNFKLLSNT